jgi:hypothetical protein
MGGSRRSCSTSSPTCPPRTTRRAPGGRGSIADDLGETNFGIVCLTPANTESPWVNFEAGALSKQLAEARCATLLVALRPADVTGPLSQFMHTETTRDDILKLLETINGHAGDKAIPREVLHRTFDKFWSELEDALANAAQLCIDPQVPASGAWRAWWRRSRTGAPAQPAEDDGGAGGGRTVSGLGVGLD